mmetsp:Transcript_75653/g.202267  ORF Transcript_75653/g.202267 Transcript_75653/m.202267 type:complete len:336 (+) Transcript_75653:3434-4441(+)
MGASESANGRGEKANSALLPQLVVAPCLALSKILESVGARRRWPVTLMPVVEPASAVNRCPRNTPRGDVPSGWRTVMCRWPVVDGIASNPDPVASLKHTLYEPASIMVNRKFSTNVTESCVSIENPGRRPAGLSSPAGKQHGVHGMSAIQAVVHHFHEPVIRIREGGKRWPRYSQTDLLDGVRDGPSDGNRISRGAPCVGSYTHSERGPDNRPGRRLVAPHAAAIAHVVGHVCRRCGDTDPSPNSLVGCAGSRCQAADRVRNLFSGMTHRHCLVVSGTTNHGSRPAAITSHPHGRHQPGSPGARQTNHSRRDSRRAAVPLCHDLHALARPARSRG